MRFSGIAALAIWIAGTGLAMADETPTEQETRLRTLLATRPADHEARFQLARLLGWQARFEEALVEYRDLVKAKPDNVDYLLGLAQSLLWNGAPREAVPLLQKARKLSPDYADLWHVEIQALLAIPDADPLQARGLRDEAQRHFPERTWHYPKLDEPPSGQDPATVSPGNVALAIPPQPESKSKTALEVGASHDRLSRHFPSWRQQYLNLSWLGEEMQRLYGGLREVRRYDQYDRETHLGGVWALVPGVQLQFEFGASDTHHILPEHYAALHAYVQPAANWSFTGGIRHSRYNTDASRVISLGVDHYIASERFSYTLFDGGPLGSRPVASHRLQWAHYYGDSSWIGLAHLRGRESENTPGNGLLTNRVSSYALTGQHGLTQKWALTWNLERVRQGDLYERSGFQLGLRHTF